MRRRIGQLAAVALFALAMLLAGPVAGAAASVTIESPPDETTTNDATPTFGGGAELLGGAVTLNVHEGASAGGPVTQELSTLPLAGTWSVTVTTPLADGTYTAVAEQAELGELGEPYPPSSPVTLTVDATPPSVSLDAIPSPSGDATPTLTGAAGTDPGDDGTVAVTILSGASTVASADVIVNGGTWSYTAAHLADGTYTAQAKQSDDAGNTGASTVRTFTIDTTSPTVTLAQPTSPSNDATPSFTGTASDIEPVTIQIYEGTKADGTVVSTATAQGNGGEWISGEAQPPLADGEYTAIATQPSSLGNPAGVSAPVTFTVDTGPPHVTLNQPKSPSNDTTPTFSGTASDSTPVTIEIHAGPSAEGPVVSTAAATGTGGAWSSGQASGELSTGEYTAVASQESSLLGNPTGFSAPVSFFVDTRSPTVTLDQPPTPSNDTTPAFTGTASDTTKVIVHIFNAANTEVATATATPNAGTWSTSNESGLANGTYTAVATQESSLGNPAGESAAVTFAVNTAPPTVTLHSPAVRSNNRTPSFNGTASDTTTVTVQIYKGTKAEGTPVSSATAQGNGGEWNSGPASPELTNGQYTAIATQASSLGNPPGASAPVTFTVDTTSPTVTLNAPPTVSNDKTPSFAGTASDTEPVTIQIYKGTEAKGTVVANATAEGNGGAWSSGAAAPPLADGQYTAIATQPSSLGNPAGVSAPATFSINTAPPKVTLNEPPKLSNHTTPSFTGTASDKTTVTVRIYAGAKAQGSVVSTATASGTGAGWSSGAASPALTSGQYTAVAGQPSSIGNEEGKSAPVTFAVDTSSPTVTLSQPPSPSNNKTPSFKGTASATEPVTIQIYEGTKAEGGEVSSAAATGTGGTWTSGAAKPELASGTHTYTAVATQKSPLGNPPGRSAPVTFAVNTLPPAVTLKALPKVSNDTAPSFEGTASDTTTVTVKIYEGKKAEGTVKSTATAAGTGGPWTSGAASPKLSTGEYTAVAAQPSSIGNPAGASAPITFKVDTNAPTVILNALASRIDDPTPSFTGAASDKTPVTVEVFAGASPCCKAISTAGATGTGGGWSSGEASPALPDGLYTAVASQPSSIGNHVGESKSVTFVVDTVAPEVTLSEPADGSSGIGESRLVRGSAGTDPHDLTGVTVRLFSGTSIAPGQTPLQSIAVNAVAGAWSTTFGGLSPGSYTVRAEQSDEAGNTGISASSTFAVTQTAAAPVRAPSSPTAAFTWFPPTPRVGENVSLVSSSTDPTSPIIAYAWDLAGNGSFATGGLRTSTTFSTPGNHVVRLRVTNGNGISSLAAATIPVGSARLPLMQPFPIVRIASIGTRSGVKLRLLSVLAAPGAQITVRCKGRRCPVKSQSHLATTGKKARAVVTFHRFQRSLAAGLTLEISVTRAGEVGKYTRFYVRRGRLPLRYDACLAGLATKPMACPSS